MSSASTERARIIPVLAEIFREHGYEGASLALISRATGLGKGSLYHFFPGGKAQMAEAVLDEIDAWFKANVFEPLRGGGDPDLAIAGMLEKVETYFQSGGRICLVGAFALGDARERFARQVRGYFREWTQALAGALVRAGHAPPQAMAMAQDCVAGIQGALVLARALDEDGVFARAMVRLQARLAARHGDHDEIMFRPPRAPR